MNYTYSTLYKHQYANSLRIEICMMKGNGIMTTWKMCSTAMAEPVLSQKKEISYNYLFTHQEYKGVTSEMI